MKKNYLIAALTLFVVGSIGSVFTYFGGPLITDKVPPGTWAFTSYLILSCSCIGSGLLLFLAILLYKKGKVKNQKEESRWEEFVTTNSRA